MHLQLLLSKVYLYLRDAFKSAAVTRRWLCSLWIARCKCMKYRLELEIQSSRECCGSRNIRSLKCFLKHFSKRHQDQLLSLFFLAPSFIPALQIYVPLHFIPTITPHLQYSGPDFTLHSPKTPIYK